MIPFLAVVIVASWVSAIAIISVQNATPVTLHFLVWRSIPIPFGVALAFSVTGGAVAMALLQGFWGWLTPSDRADPPLESPDPTQDYPWDEDALDDRR